MNSEILVVNYSLAVFFENEFFHESENLVSSLLLDKERNSVSSPDQGPPPECYLKYFLHQSPPQGLLVDHPTSERFICQSIPDSPDSDFFATLFDNEAGIAILSAYTVTNKQAQRMGDFPREKVSNSWRQTEGESNLRRCYCCCRCCCCFVVVVVKLVHEPSFL